jgi:hypothetical protein
MTTPHSAACCQGWRVAERVTAPAQLSTIRGKAWRRAGALISLRFFFVTSQIGTHGAEQAPCFNATLVLNQPVTD